MTNARLETLVWLLIYSGVALAIVGLWTLSAVPAVGAALLLVGVVDAAAGIVLIWWRSRRPADAVSPSSPQGPR